MTLCYQCLDREVIPPDHDTYYVCWECLFKRKFGTHYYSRTERLIQWIKRVLA